VTTPTLTSPARFDHCGPAVPVCRGPAETREFFATLRGRSDPERTLAHARSEPLYRALRLVAPGTPLREGIDRILQAKMGALIVVGDEPAVLNICSGGFLLDAEFTPQRLSELAKMDGAIILDRDCSRIIRAAVHLVPDSAIHTEETGTRHRTVALGALSGAAACLLCGAKGDLLGQRNGQPPPSTDAGRCGGSQAPMDARQRAILLRTSSRQETPGDGSTQCAL